jgi:hypothetical protein
MSLIRFIVGHFRQGRFGEISWMVVGLEVGPELELAALLVAMLTFVGWKGLAAIGQLGWMRLMKAVGVED